MKRLILCLLRSKFGTLIFLIPILKLHTRLYEFISILVVGNSRWHPKHEIIRYEDWFLSKVSLHDVVLDIGCNEGNLTKRISDKVHQAYGIELYPPHVTNALKNLPANANVQFFCADATCFDYSSLAPINIVILSNVLEHIEDRVNFLQKIAKSVKWKDTPIFLIRVPTIERDWLPVYKKSLGLEFRLDKTHYIEHTVEEFTQEVNAAGLNITSLQVKFGEIFAECKGQ